MAFLNKFKLYDITIPDGSWNLLIKAEVFDYVDGKFLTKEDGRVDKTDELIPYTGDNADTTKTITKHNNNTYRRLLNDEQLILKYLEENSDSPKHQQQKKYVSDVKSYFRYWYDQKDINPPEKGFYHSDDYRHLRLDGADYLPTAKQTTVIEILHRNYLNGTPDISQQFIITQMEGDRETRYKKVKEYFNFDADSKLLYKTFIKTGRRRGSIRINLK